MDNISIKIGDREIPLRFKMTEFAEIEEEIGNLGEVRDLLLKGKKRIRNIAAVIRILGNAGLKHAEEPADLTDEWLLENMNPYELMAYQLAVMACMTKESESQAAAEEDKDKEVDVVLEEINRKKETVNSHTGA